MKKKLVTECKVHLWFQVAPGGLQGDDEYAATVDKLQKLLTERKGHYSVADVRVSLAHPQGDANRGAAPAVVAHRYRRSLLPAEPPVAQLMRFGI